MPDSKHIQSVRKESWNTILPFIHPYTWKIKKPQTFLFPTCALLYVKTGGGCKLFFCHNFLQISSVLKRYLWLFLSFIPHKNLYWIFWLLLYTKYTASITGRPQNMLVGLLSLTALLTFAELKHFWNHPMILKSALLPTKKKHPGSLAHMAVSLCGSYTP